MAGGQIKQPRLKFLGRPREVFASAESDSDTQRGRGIIQLGQQGFKELLPDSEKKWGKKLLHVSDDFLSVCKVFQVKNERGEKSASIAAGKASQCQMIKGKISHFVFYELDNRF